jgi:hypothetical protein
MAESFDNAIARELRRFRLLGAPDGWRLFNNDVRIDGPWRDSEFELAEEALSAAQAKAVVDLLRASDTSLYLLLT